jgi:hypothetical protein
MNAIAARMSNQIDATSPHDSVAGMKAAVIRTSPAIAVMSQGMVRFMGRVFGVQCSVFGVRQDASGSARETLISDVI